MLLGFIDWFLPRSGSEDPDLQRRGRLLVAGSIGFFFICLFFGLQMAVLRSYPTLNLVVVFLGCVLALINLLLLRATGSATLPGLLFCLEATGIIAFQAYHDLGLNDPVLLWYAVIPWLAAFLIRPIFGFVFAGLAAAITGGFYILEMQGHPFPNHISPEEAWLFLFLQLSGVALYIGTLGWVYEGQTLRNLRKTNQDLREARDALKKSNQRIESILESITDGFFALDYNGRFSYVNHQAEQIFGRGRKELVGEPAEDYLRGRAGRETLKHMRQAARDGSTVQFSTYHAERERWYDVRIYPYSDGLSVYFNDVTERKAYEKGLIEAKEKAEELARLKSAFLTNMSHEIRTPLTSIIGFADVLEESASGEDLEFVQLIRKSGKRLMRTLNSVLDLARLESDSAEGHFEPVDVAEEVREVSQLLRPLAEEKGLYLRVHCKTDNPQAVLDKTFLNRILNNLISNAIKFTEEGGVTVDLKGSDEHIEFCVADTGIGISEEFRSHIFDEFRQESTGLGRSHEGSGLGLTITQRLVNALGGAIKVESKKDVGTTFTVRLPRHDGAFNGALGEQ